MPAHFLYYYRFFIQVDKYNIVFLQNVIFKLGENYEYLYLCVLHILFRILIPKPFSLLFENGFVAHCCPRIQYLSTAYALIFRHLATFRGIYRIDSDNNASRPLLLYFFCSPVSCSCRSNVRKNRRLFVIIRCLLSSACSSKVQPS